MVTISDVAREANVSPATVSRVINNSLVVSASKRQRVLEAIEKLGYVLPSRNASAGRLVLVISDVSNADMSNQLYQSLADGGFQMFQFYFCEGPNTQADLQNFLAQMPLQQIAGIILYNFVRDIDESLHRMLDEFPIVQIGCNQAFRRTISLEKNNFQATYEATRHLLELGCKRVAFFSAGVENSLSILRHNQINGYRSALLDYGFAPQDWIVESDFTVEGCYESTLQLLQRSGERPDGFVCPIDSMAVGCLRAIHDCGLRVPEDISMISLMGSWCSRFLKPSLSSLDFPPETICRETVRQLQLLIAEPSPVQQTIFLPFSFTFRESTSHMR